MIHKAVERIWAGQLDVSVGEVSLVCADDNITFYWAEVTQMDCLICVLFCIKAVLCLKSICVEPAH